MGIPRTSGVYTILSKTENKIYIGSTKDFLLRKLQHFSCLDRQIHTNKFLQNVYNLYGKEDLIFEVLVECPLEFIRSEENYWCNLVGTYSKEIGFNIKSCYPQQVLEFSEEVLNIMRTKRRLRIISEETKQKMSNSKKGKLPKNYNEFRHSTLGRKRSDKELKDQSMRQKKIVYKFSKEGVLLNEYGCAKEAILELGYGYPENITTCARKNQEKYSAYGYYWKYINKFEFN